MEPVIPNTMRLPCRTAIIDDYNVCQPPGVWLIVKASWRKAVRTRRGHCPVPLIGVTGSAGKTTTTTLVGLMLGAAGFTVHVGGNIGTPLFDRLDAIGPGDKAVMEFSSFQLELFT